MAEPEHPERREPELRDVVQGARRSAEVMVAWMHQVAPAVNRVAQRFHCAMWQLYERAGKPYGETEEGLLRWVAEEGHKARVQADAEYERDRRLGPGSAR